MKSINKKILYITALYYCANTLLALAFGETIEDFQGEICTVATTKGYEYQNYYEVNKSWVAPDGSYFLMKFYAQGKSDAHIALTVDNSNSSKYEVVIGGGNNTFTTMRKFYKTTNFVDHNSTYTYWGHGFLNVDKPTGFWIQVFRNGLFSIGKLGDGIPYIAWTDPSPMTVSYFSFSAWDSVVVKWLFNCYGNPNSDKADDQTTLLTPTERLRKDILKKSNPFKPPTDEKTNILDVTITIDFQYTHLDVMTSKLNLRGFATFEWTDSSLCWDPIAYHNISKLHLSHYELWRPEFVLQNFLEPSVNMFSEVKISVNSDGKIVWRPAFSVQTTCNTDLRFWPWDVHNCTVSLITWSYNILNVHYEVNQNYENACPQVVHSDWKINQLRSSYVAENTPWNDDMNTDTKNISLQLEIEVSRNTNSLGKLFHTPIIIISFMWLSSFCVWFNSNLKFTIISMSIILLTLMIVTIMTYVPVYVQNPPILFEAYLKVVLIVSIDAFTSLFFIAFRSRKLKNDHISFELMRFLTTPIVAKLFVLPKLGSQLGVDGELLLPNTEQTTTMCDIVFVAVERILFLLNFTITILILIFIKIR